MAVMTRWDAFHDLRAAQDQMDYLNRLFMQARGQDLQQSGSSVVSGASWAPAADISERKDVYVVAVELPGVKVGDLEITFQNGLLTIQGERRMAPDSPDEQFHLIERRCGLFRRSITLPQHVVTDAIEASFEDGVLRILVPKAEVAKPKRIDVKPAQMRTPALAGVSHGTTN